jgi:hypothetical protein
MTMGRKSILARKLRIGPPDPGSEPRRGFRERAIGATRWRGLAAIVTILTLGIGTAQVFAGRAAMAQNQNINTNSAGNSMLFKPWLTGREFGELFGQNPDTVARWRKIGDPRITEYRQTTTGFEYRNPLPLGHELGTGTNRGQDAHEPSTDQARADAQK